MTAPEVDTEITGLPTAIAYAEQLETWSKDRYQTLQDIIPNAEAVAADCETKYATLQAAGVEGTALTEVAKTQEEVTTAAQQLQDALHAFELATASTTALREELASHMIVREGYQAVDNNAGSKEFNTGE